MKNAISKLVITSVALGLACTFPAAANAGKGGGMSGGHMSHSMGSTGSRSMSSGMSMRSMGNSLSSRSFSSPSRMSSSNMMGRSGVSSSATRNLSNNGFNRVRSNGSSNNSLGNAVSNLRNLPSRGVNTKSNRDGVAKDLGKNKGDMLKGKLRDVVGRRSAKDFTEGKLSELKDRGTRGRLTDVLGGKSSLKDSAIANRGRVSDMLKNGRLKGGDVAKIDRSKLRDLVKGIEGGKSKGLKGAGVVFTGFEKSKLAGVIGAGQLKPGDMFAGKVGTFKGDKGLVAACFPHKDHHHGNHWFDFCFGNFWFDYCYDYPVYDHYYYYDYCSVPCYTYPSCDVTYGSNPEVVTLSPEVVTLAADANTLSPEVMMVAATKPVVLDEEINLASPSDASTVADSANAEGQLSVEDALNAALAAASTASDESNGSASADSDGTLTAEPAKDAGPAIESDADLELIDVRMVDAGKETTNGPRFKVTVRNVGKRALDAFLVSLVACKDAQIDSTSVHASTTVDKLAAGDEATVEVAFAANSLYLGSNAGGNKAGFNTLIADVDSDERVSEGNEENNLALLDLTEIKLVSN
jgi:CARDB protein